MEISTIISKRRRRVIGLSYIEYGLPNVETIIDGKRVNLIDEPHFQSSKLKIPFNIRLFHRNSVIRKITPFLSRFQNLPDHYEKSTKSKRIDKLNVKKLIIGGGTSGLFSLDRESLLISREIIGDLEYDESPIPQIEREELLKKLEGRVKEFEGRIIKGNFLGKFDDGLLFETEDRFLLVNANNIVIASGGRTIRPIFTKNYLPGVVSRELYLSKLKNKYTNIIVLGFSNLTIRTALNAKNATIIYPKGVKPVFSSFYKEKAKEKGITIIEGIILDIKKNKGEMKVITDKEELSGDLIVFSSVKQPKIEIMSNIGLGYKFNKALHIYQPQNTNEVNVVGGSYGFSNDFLSFMSSSGYLDLALCKEFDPGVCDNGMEQEKSPYLYSEDGMVCECEDLDMRDISFSTYLVNNVEGIKRVTGLGTGHCQGKVCSFLAGSITNSNSLISFRSPLYPVVI